MNREEIIRLAGHREVRPWVVKLVADAVAAEREACESACDRVYHQHIGPQFGEVRYGIAACKDAIRARGQA